MEENKITEEDIELAKEFNAYKEKNEINNKMVKLEDVNVNQLEVKIDKTKGIEEQAEDIVNAMAVSQATTDKKFVDKLAEKKKEAMQDKAETKTNTAKAEKTESETKKSKASFSLHETVFNAFSIQGHLTEKASKIVLPIFTVLYLVVSLIEGFPFMVLQILLNNLDGLFGRYEQVGEERKFKVRLSMWVLLAIAIILSIVLGSLAGCGII